MAVQMPWNPQRLQPLAGAGHTLYLVYPVRLFPLRNPRLYSSLSHVGLVIIPSFVSQEEQKNLVRWCLSGQARYPNETNLDAHYILPKDGLWNTCLDSRNDPSKDILIKPKALESPECIAKEPVGGRRQLIDNTPANPENFPSISSAPKPPPSPSPTVPPSLASALLAKLRWANIGFSYHWGSKQYDFSKEKQPVNSQIRDVCKRAVAAVDWEQVYGGSDSEWGDEGPTWKTWNDTYGTV